MSASEPRWLDRLARRAARRERGYAPVRIADRGLSRRTVLRAAGAAVALGATGRYLGHPPVARADAFSDCVDYHNKAADELYQRCSAGPTRAYQHYDSAINHATNALKNAKTKAQRARLDNIIQQAKEGRRKAVNHLMDCGFQYAHNRSAVVPDCRVTNPPAGDGGAGAGGGGASGGSGGCPEGTTLCAKTGDVTYCCYGSDACCSCQGGIVCCIYPDCRCCS
jgi:hypothetical protein